MIYLVTKEQSLFESELYKIISVEESLAMLNSWRFFQIDSETDGRDAHINKLLCVQFGNDSANTRIVVDCQTINIKLYKDVIENSFLIGHNLKFDLQFLYSVGIVPLRVWDTMIVEQLLYLGYPSGIKRYSLLEVAYSRLGVNIDKTVRGEIIWRGLDDSVIIYAAGDVTYLEKIMNSQYDECKQKDCLQAAKLECDFVPAIAYLEWCGIKLDERKWKDKMQKDQEKLYKSKKALNDWFVNLSELSYLESNETVTINYTEYNDIEFQNFQQNKKQLLFQKAKLIDCWETCGHDVIHYEKYQLPVPSKSVVDLKKKYVFVDLQGDLFSGSIKNSLLQI